LGWNNILVFAGAKSHDRFEMRVEVRHDEQAFAQNFLNAGDVLKMFFILDRKILDLDTRKLQIIAWLSQSMCKLLPVI